MQESTYKRQKKRTTLRLQPTDAMITLLFGPGFYSRLSAYELFFYCWKASKWPSAASHRIFFVCSACYQLNSTRNGNSFLFLSSALHPHDPGTSDEDKGLAQLKAFSPGSFASALIQQPIAMAVTTRQLQLFLH